MFKQMIEIPMWLYCLICPLAGAGLLIVVFSLIKMFK